MPRTATRTTLAAALLGALTTAGAQTADASLKPVTVESARDSQLGEAATANSGVVLPEQLEARTIYRPGELLEVVPGLIVSQHSGEGKANQFYLRGFNLDHGTDLRTSVMGMPVNQRSHAHGQGWTDLNFLIPELVTRLDYRKGPFYAAYGDFASAGAVDLQYADELTEGIASVSVGQYGFARTLLAASPAVGPGHLTYAVELLRNNGPFVQGDNFQKFNGVLRYSQGTMAEGFDLTAMAYQTNRYHATDQIPKRLVDAGLLDRFASIDPTDGGQVSRYSLSGGWHRDTGTSLTKVDAYVIRNRLALFSNFTYALDNPVDGDQFAQPDRRVVSGLNASHTWNTPFGGRDSETTVGLQLQNDNIYNGLLHTVAQRTVGVTRQDHIVETSLGLYVENATRWTSHFRTVAGLRADSYRFRVRSDNPLNSGTATDTVASPKLNLIFGPWAKTEFYAGWGRGFHSNDARGATITVDPKTGDPVERVSPLARSRGIELGVRSEVIPGLQSSLSLYRLDADSELVFVGDAGTTEPSRPSRRMGVEFSNYWKVNRWLTLDADLAFARARFRDADPAGDRIPGAVEGVAAIALAVDRLGPWFGAVQLRYFGPRPLIEDNSVRSRPTATLNGRIGYRINPKLRVELEGYNLANRRASAIDYFYTSQVRGEAAPVDDIHFHPIESRSFRLTLTAAF